MPRGMYVGKEEEMQRMYIEEEKSLGDIAQILGGTRQGIWTVLKRAGVVMRSKSEARIIALKKGKFATHTHHQFNREFFNEWSPAMAYILGLIYADGHVYRAGFRFGFGRKSLDIANSICKIMESDRLPKEIDNNGFPGYLLIYDSYGIAERLKEIGLPWGKKALIIRYPKNMPDEMDRHFIRGFWDGDGSASGNLIRFHSSSILFLEGIRYHFSCLGVPTDRGKIHQEKGRTNTFPQGVDIKVKPSGVLLYSQWQARADIFHLFYDDVPEHCFSLRKYELYKGMISLTEKPVQRIP